LLFGTDYIASAVFKQNARYRNNNNNNKPLKIPEE
jgi:hypothetical protein